MNDNQVRIGVAWYCKPCKYDTIWEDKSKVARRLGEDGRCQAIIGFNSNQNIKEHEATSKRGQGQPAQRQLLLETSRASHSNKIHARTWLRDQAPKVATAVPDKSRSLPLFSSLGSK